MNFWDSKQFYFGLSLVAAIVSIIAVVLWASSINQGSIKPLAAAPNPPTSSVKNLKSQYIELQYDGQYLARSLTPKNGDIELYELTANTTYDKRLIVSVSRLPDSQLSQNSAYNFRLAHPEIYSLTNQKVDGLQAIAATKQDETEITVFIQRADKISVLSFVTASPADNIAAEAQRVLKSFHWK